MRVELESVSQEPGLDPATREKVASVLEETERLGRTVEGLFAISRLEAGEALMDVTGFDLSELVLSTADQMALLAEEKKLTVRSADCVPVEVAGRPLPAQAGHRQSAGQRDQIQPRER